MPGFVLAVLLTFSFFASSSLTQAQTYVWDGGGGDNNWSTGTNWNPDGAPPTSSGSANFTFTTSALRPSPNLEASYAINSLTFGSGGGAFSFTGGGGNETLTINAGGIVNNSGSAQSFANSLETIALGASQTWDAGSSAGGSLTIGSAVNLGATQTLTISGSNNTTINGSISGAGSSILKSGSGVLTFTQPNSFSGNLNITNGTVLLATTNGLLLRANTPVTVAAGATLQINATNPTPTWENAMDLTLNGGTYAQGGGVTNTGAWVRNLTLTPGALMTTNSPTGSYANENLGVHGTITMTGAGTATISLQDGLALGFGGSSTFNIGTGSTLVSSTPFRNLDGQSGNTTGLIKTGDGTLSLTNTALSTYTGATTLSAGTLSTAVIKNGGVASGLGSSSNAASNLIFDGGTLQYTGSTDSSNRNFTITAGKTATIDIQNPATTLTLSGASPATTGGLTKTGSGTLALTTAQTYTGSTIINGGTLLLGANNILADTSNVTLNGGRLATGGYSDTAGTLTLSSSSIIDMGTATSALSFANSAGTGTWNGTLSIFNWPFNQSTVRFGTGSTGLTTTQLSNIRVYTGPDNSSPSWTPSIDGNGYLVVVPEPGAVLAGMFLLVGIGWRERAQFLRIRREA